MLVGAARRSRGIGGRYLSFCGAIARGAWPILGDTLLMLSRTQPSKQNNNKTAAADNKKSQQGDYLKKMLSEKGAPNI